MKNFKMKCKQETAEKVWTADKEAEELAYAKALWWEAAQQAWGNKRQEHRWRGDWDGGLNLWWWYRELEPQVHIDIHMARLINGLNSPEGDKGDKGDSQFLKEIGKLRIHFITLSKLLSIFSEVKSVSHSDMTLCNPMDCSLPSSLAYGNLQARILEWVSIPFFRGSSWPRDQTRVSHIAGTHFTIWVTSESGTEK